MLGEKMCSGVQSDWKISQAWQLIICNNHYIIFLVADNDRNSPLKRETKFHTHIKQ
jgi:hypothetical protein